MIFYHMFNFSFLLINNNVWHMSSDADISNNVIFLDS